MTGEISLHDLVAGQAYQHPEAFTGFQGLKANFVPDPNDADAVQITVEQIPGALTGPNDMLRARWAFEKFAERHPKKLAILDLPKPSHFTTLNPETDHAVVVAKGIVALHIASLICRDRITLGNTPTGLSGAA